jgi:hypothetical protein
MRIVVLAAHTLQKEIGDQGAGGVRAVYGAYLLAGRDMLPGMR